MSEISDNLLATIELLETHGWLQGELGDHQRGFCIVGAICEIGDDADNWAPSGAMLNAVKDYHGIRSLSFWNNVEGRTKEEVINLLQETIDSL